MQLELSSPLALTQDGKPTLSSIIVQHFSTNGGSSNRIVPQVTSWQSCLPEGLIQDSTCLKRKAASGMLYSCHPQQKVTQSEHRYSAWQQWCCASLRRLSKQPVILCVLSFATSSSGNSAARTSGMPSTVCLLKYSRLLLTLHRAIQQAVLPLLPLQYQLLRSSTSVRIIKGV